MPAMVQPSMHSTINRPMEIFTMDILALPTTQGGNKYLLVIVHMFTEFSWAFPVPNQEAGTVVGAFLKVLNFGTPAHVLTDRGVQFTSKLFTTLCDILGVQQLFTTAFHPQGDGQTEHMNRNIIAKLAKTVSPSCDDWNVWLPMTMLAYNTELHA